MNPAKPEHQGSRGEKYRGSLSAAQIAEEMNAARRNALRLATDAQLLLDADRLPTATAVAALSIEESGKVSIIRQFSTTAPGTMDSERGRCNQATDALTNQTGGRHHPCAGTATLWRCRNHEFTVIGRLEKSETNSAD